MPEDKRITDAELREMLEYCEAANTSPGLEVTNKNPLHAWCIRQIGQSGTVIVGVASFEMKADAIFDFRSRTDLPHVVKDLQAERAKIDRLRAGVIAMSGHVEKELATNAAPGLRTLLIKCANELGLYGKTEEKSSEPN